MGFFNFLKKKEEDKDVRVIIPKEDFLIIEFKNNNMPGIAVVNVALKDSKLKEVFSWNCSILIALEDVDENGMPSKEELKILEEFERYLNSNIIGEDTQKQNAVFFCRDTCDSTRQLIWKVYDPKIANQFLENLIEQNNYPLEFDYRIEEDKNWKITEWYLKAATIT